MIDSSGIISDTKDRLSFFKENGWYVTEKIISSKRIEKARKAASEVFSGVKDCDIPYSSRISMDQEDGIKSLLNYEFSMLQKTGIWELGTDENLLSLAAELLETNNLRLFSDSLINKKSKSGLASNFIGWHTDRAYWPTCSSDQLITAWIPLQDITIDMGPLQVITGSHLWDHEDLAGLISFSRNNLEAVDKYISSKHASSSCQKMVLKAGQVSFHHCRALHSSFINQSGIDRLSLTIHFQGHLNHYREQLDDNGNIISISYDDICSKDTNNQPNYADNKIFPLVYSQRNANLF